LPATGRDLRSLAWDLQVGLDYSELLIPLTVDLADLPDRLVNARCRPVAPSVSPGRVADELQRLWREDIRYEHELDRVRIDVEATCVALEAITIALDSSHYVTIRLVVELPEEQWGEPLA
jgi:hypothetical protein